MFINNSASSLLSDIVPIVGILITTGVNLYSVFILQNKYEEPIKSSLLKILVLSAFVQWITMGPAMIFALLHDVFDLDAARFQSVSTFLLAFAGFTNSLVYFYVRKSSFSDQKVQEKDDMNSSLSELVLI